MTLRPRLPPVDVTVSIGIAVLPDHGTTSTTLLRRADEALPAAEQGGCDGERVAEPEHRPASAAEPGRRPS